MTFFAVSANITKSPKYATRGGAIMNTNKIKAKIVECGLTQREVAEIIGISANSFSRKLHGKRDFLLSEVIALCSVLEFDNPEEIF